MGGFMLLLLGLRLFSDETTRQHAPRAIELIKYQLALGARSGLMENARLGFTPFMALIRRVARTPKQPHSLLLWRGLGWRVCVLCVE